jgi:hypothetical protein
MKTTSLLFGVEMVKAILAGTKTQTRRTHGLDWVNQNPYKFGLFNTAIKNETFHAYLRFTGPASAPDVDCKAKVAPGDVIYVKETFRLSTKDDYSCKIGTLIYRASVDRSDTGPWKPSIFMPKSSARIWLRVKEVRCERVSKISKKDVISEGTPGFELENASEEEARACYRDLWCKINGTGSWDYWCFAYTFERIEKPC